MTAVTLGGPADGTSDRKAVLVCPTCGHESPVDGDWAVTERDVGADRRRVYECPECWTTLLAQPVFGDCEVPPA